MLSPRSWLVADLAVPPITVKAARPRTAATMNGFTEKILFATNVWPVKKETIEMASADYEVAGGFFSFSFNIIVVLMTVSGLSDKESMPCSANQSASSG